MATPYHVRLTISQYGDHFRAELFTEDLGDTDGDLLPVPREILNDWMPYLAQGATGLPPDAARKLGKELFAAILGKAENSKKWSQLLEQARRQGRALRILIDATTDEVRDLPYGLLCEPHDNFFLFRPSRGRPAIQFVRVLRRCTPRPFRLSIERGPLRVLLAAAEPCSPDVPAFAAARWLCELARGLAEMSDAIAVVILTPEGCRPIGQVVPGPASSWRPEQFEPFCRTTRDELQAALDGGKADILHLLAHGLGGDGLMLCEPGGGRAEVTAGELGEWCGRSALQMAFLQVCKASRIDDRGGFGGIAQQLLNPNYGNLAAVVASAYPLDAERSTPVALRFYRGLAEGKSPDEALGRDAAEADWTWAFLELWARPGALTGTGPREAQQFPSPYRGLAPFLERDNDLFFGRSDETHKLLRALSKESVLAVAGDPGSGKSSLLHAGLASGVRRDGLAGIAGWRTISLRPGREPARSLMAALAPLCEEGRPIPKDWHAALKQLLADATAPDRPLLILFDQFEEIFALCEDESQRRAVSEALAEALRGRPQHLRLVLGIRDDYLGPAAALPGLGRLLKRPWVVQPPQVEDWRTIVEEPARLHGYSFQGPLSDGDPRHGRALLDRILDDRNQASGPDGVAGASGAPMSTMAVLPLLEFALERLWLRAIARGSREFTHDDYDEIGGLRGALAQHAEETYAALVTDLDAGPAAQRMAEQILTGVVGPGGIRRPRRRDELEAETRNPGLARRVIDGLVAARLLTIRTDPAHADASWVEIRHQALVDRWDRLACWLTDGRRERVIADDLLRRLRLQELRGNRYARTAVATTTMFVAMTTVFVAVATGRIGGRDPVPFLPPPVSKEVVSVQQITVRDTIQEFVTFLRDKGAAPDGPLPVSFTQVDIQQFSEEFAPEIFEKHQKNLAQAVFANWAQSVLIQAGHDCCNCKEHSTPGGQRPNNSEFVQGRDGHSRCTCQDPATPGGQHINNNRCATPEEIRTILADFDKNRGQLADLPEAAAKEVDAVLGPRFKTLDDALEALKKLAEAAAPGPAAKEVDAVLGPRFKTLDDALEALKKLAEAAAPGPAAKEVDAVLGPRFKTLDDALEALKKLAEAAAPGPAAKEVDAVLGPRFKTLDDALSKRFTTLETMLGVDFQRHRAEPPKDGSIAGDLRRIADRIALLRGVIVDGHNIPLKEIGENSLLGRATRANGNLDTLGAIIAGDRFRDADLGISFRKMTGGFGFAGLLLGSPKDNRNLAVGAQLAGADPILGNPPLPNTFQGRGILGLLIEHELKRDQRPVAPVSKRVTEFIAGILLNRDFHPRMRAAAARSLGECGLEAAPHLVHILKTEQIPDVHGAAWVALGQINVDGALERDEGIWKQLSQDERNKLRQR